MSDDLIRRSDAIKAVNKAKAEGMTECPTYYLGIVPTIEPKRGEWTPCSERLPEENEEVLVCDEDGTMEVCDLEMFGRGIGLKWTDKSGYECWLDVVAWMPLPEPYREREGE